VIDNGGENAEHCRQSFDLLIMVRWLSRPLAKACDRFKTMRSSLCSEQGVLCFVSRIPWSTAFSSDSTHHIHSCRIATATCRNKVSLPSLLLEPGHCLVELDRTGGVQVVTTLLTISLRRHDVGRKTRLVAGVPRRWTRRYTTSRDWRDAGEDERWSVPGHQVQHAEAANGQSGEPDHCVEVTQFEAMAVLPLCVYCLDLGCIR
jgi:hypothetical protein